MKMGVVSPVEKLERVLLEKCREYGLRCERENLEEVPMVYDHKRDVVLYDPEAVWDKISYRRMFDFASEYIESMVVHERTHRELVREVRGRCPEMALTRGEIFCSERFASEAELESLPEAAREREVEWETFAVRHECEKGRLEADPHRLAHLFVAKKELERHPACQRLASKLGDLPKDICTCSRKAEEALRELEREGVLSCF